MNTGERIGLLRRERGLNQGELAQAAGLSRRTVNRIEHDPRRVPDTASLVAVADALGVPLAALFAADRDSLEVRLNSPAGRQLVFAVEAAAAELGPAFEALARDLLVHLHAALNDRRQALARARRDSAR